MSKMSLSIPKVLKLKLLQFLFISQQTSSNSYASTVTSPKIPSPRKLLAGARPSARSSGTGAEKDQFSKGNTNFRRALSAFNTLDVNSGQGASDFNGTGPRSRTQNHDSQIVKKLPGRLPNICSPRKISTLVSNPNIVATNSNRRRNDVFISSPKKSKTNYNDSTADPDEISYSSPRKSRINSTSSGSGSIKSTKNLISGANEASISNLFNEETISSPSRVTKTVSSPSIATQTDFDDHQILFFPKADAEKLSPDDCNTINESPKTKSVKVEKLADTRYSKLPILLTDSVNSPMNSPTKPALKCRSLPPTPTDLNPTAVPVVLESPSDNIENDEPLKLLNLDKLETPTSTNKLSLETPTSVRSNKSNPTSPITEIGKINVANVRWTNGVDPKTHRVDNSKFKFNSDSLKCVTGPGPIEFDLKSKGADNDCIDQCHHIAKGKGPFNFTNENGDCLSLAYTTDDSEFEQPESTQNLKVNEVQSSKPDDDTLSRGYSTICPDDPLEANIEISSKTGPDSEAKMDKVRRSPKTVEIDSTNQIIKKLDLSVIHKDSLSGADKNKTEETSLSHQNTEKQNSPNNVASAVKPDECNHHHDQNPCLALIIPLSIKSDNPEGQVESPLSTDRSDDVFSTRARFEMFEDLIKKNLINPLIQDMWALAGRPKKVNNSSRKNQTAAMLARQSRRLHRIASPDTNIVELELLWKDTLTRNVMDYLMKFIRSNCSNNLMPKIIDTDKYNKESSATHLDSSVSTSASASEGNTNPTTTLSLLPNNSPKSLSDSQLHSLGFFTAMADILKSKPAVEVFSEFKIGGPSEGLGCCGTSSYIPRWVMEDIMHKGRQVIGLIIRSNGTSMDELIDIPDSSELIKITDFLFEELKKTSSSSNSKNSVQYYEKKQILIEEYKKMVGGPSDFESDSDLEDFHLRKVAIWTMMVEIQHEMMCRW